MAYTPVNTVLWLDLPVLNLERAVAFYSQLLGIEPKSGVQHGQSATFQMSNQGSGLTLILSPAVVQGGVTPYLNCHMRLNEALAKTQLNGGKIVHDIQTMEPFGFRAVIEDCEGNRIALHSAE